MLLDRLDQLPLRRHEIRGNPAGLLARLLARIDALKAEAVGPTKLEARARERRHAADRRGRARGGPRELEFAELFTAHDRILAAAGSLDRGDVFLALDCLLVERPDVRREIARASSTLMVDELEEATPAQRAILATLAADNPTTSTCWRRREDGRAPGSATSTPTATSSSSSTASASRSCASGAAPTSAPRRRRSPARSSTWSPAAPTRSGSACSSTTRRRRAAPWRRRWRSAASPSTSPARPPSSSGPRCATRSPGCASSPTPTTRRRRRGR